MKRKALIIAPYFHPHTGGLENYVLNIAKGLKKNKWDVVVVTSNEKSKRKVINKVEGIKIYRLPFWIRISNTPINPFWILEIRKIIKEEKPALINAHAPVPFIADIAAMSAGKTPFILTYHTGSMKKNRFLLDTLIHLYENLFIKFTVSKASVVICSSSFVKNFLKTKTNIKSKSFVINPGVNIKSKGKFTKKGNNILFVGGLSKAEKHKGLEYLIKAAVIVKQSVPKFKLTIVGDGNGLKDYKEDVSKFGLKNNVVFKGELKTDKLSKIYNNSNLLVLPSLNESFGTVLIEAMARKIPVIGSNIGGIPEIIDNNKNGFVVTPKNSIEIANTIIKVLRNEGLAKRLGESGYKKVEKKYLWKYQIAYTEEIFNRALNEK